MESEEASDSSSDDSSPDDSYMFDSDEEFNGLVEREIEEEGIRDIVALHHTKRTYMCTCITLSTLYGLQTLDPIEVH